MGFNFIFALLSSSSEETQPGDFEGPIKYNPLWVTWTIELKLVLQVWFCVVTPGENILGDEQKQWKVAFLSYFPWRENNGHSEILY